ncbi:MAG: hypothetical protein WCF19_02700 [Chlamydiales bacterium]
MAAAQPEEKPIAPESLKTKRAREKLVKQWKAEEELITPKALKETTDKIHKWIADNAKHRLPIKKETNIRLFNQNKDPAGISKKIHLFAEKLKADMEHLSRAFDP